MEFSVCHCPGVQCEVLYCAVARLMDSLLQVAGEEKTSLCLGYVHHSHVLTSNLCVQIGCPLAWYIESDNSRQMDAYELIYVD